MIFGISLWIPTIVMNLSILHCTVNSSTCPKECIFYETALGQPELSKNIRQGIVWGSGTTVKVTVPIYQFCTWIAYCTTILMPYLLTMNRKCYREEVWRCFGDNGKGRTSLSKLIDLIAS